MFSTDKRTAYFENVMNHLSSSNLVKGVVQLGSGVIGYKDEYSDIDLMVSTSSSEDVEKTKDFIQEVLLGLDPAYVKV